MTREEFRDKKSRDYRKRRESYGIKDPVYLDEIEEAYYQGMVDADKHPHWISVEDELPPIIKQSTRSWPRSKEVLIYCKEDDVVTIGFYIENMGWKCMTGEYIGPVTHWMSSPSVEHLKDK